MISSELAAGNIDKVLRTGTGWSRTALHVELESGEVSESPIQTASKIVADPADFNAVGSRSPSRSKLFGEDIHFPVIGVHSSGRVAVTPQSETGDRVKISSSPTAKHPLYTSDSFLKDVLGKHGIDLEVFEPLANLGTGQHTLDLVLRSDEGVLEVARPTFDEDFEQLYIQREFSGDDHRKLISELGHLGIISPEWQHFTEQQGMGIVAAPWTEHGTPQLVA